MPVKQHLVKAFPGHILLTPTNFPRVFNDPRVPGEVITELDGVYILSSDPTTRGDNMELNIKLPVAKELRHELASRAKQLRVLEKGMKQVTIQPNTQPNHLVIVEAKHHVTRDKIMQKLEQMKQIEEYLKSARNLNDTTLLDKFKKSVALYGFDKYAPRVRLYIGGVLWDDDAVRYVQELLDTEIKDYIGVVQPTGSRYGVYDVSNTFGASQSDVLLLGGKATKKKKKKSQSST